MKIKSDFVLQKVAEHWVAVATGKGLVDFDGMVSFNATALFLWQLLSTDQSEESLVKSLMAEYEIDETTAKEGVDSFLRQLRENSLLEE